MLNLNREMKKLTIFGLVFLLLISTSALSWDASNWVVYDDFEQATINTSAWTVTGAGLSTHHFISNAQSVNINNTQNIRSLDLPDLTGTSKTVVSFWVNQTTSQSCDGSNWGTFRILTGGNSVLFSVYSGDINFGGGNWEYSRGVDTDTGISCESGTTDVASDMVNVMFFIDNVNEKLGVVLSDGTTQTTIINNVSYASPSTATKLQFYSYGEMYIDYIEHWDYATYGYTSPNPPNSPANNFTISLVDFYDSVGINNFSVEIAGEVNYTTTTGSITTNILSNDTSLYEIKVISDDYFNRTYLNYNASASGNLQAANWQSELWLTPVEQDSGVIITSGNFTTDLQTAQVGTGLYLRAGNYNVTFYNDSYQQTTYNYSIGALENLTRNHTIADSLLNITAYDLIGNHIIENFNITVRGTNNSFDSSQTVADGNATFYVTQMNEYNLTFKAAGYQDKTVILQMTNNSQLYSFQIFTTNSVNITFIDEETNNVVTELITVEFISGTQSYNFSTSTGYLYQDLIAPESYTIRYSSPNYNLRQYYFTLTEASHTGLTLYMGNTTNTEEVTVNVYDQTTSDEIEGAIVRLQRYFISDNSYKTVDEATTDEAGQVEFDIEQDNELYKFIVVYNGETRLNTDAQYITATTINLYIDLLEDATENFFQKGSIGINVYWSEDNNYFEAVYSDGSLVATNYCLYLKQFGRYYIDDLNSSCSVTNSGTLSVSYPFVNGTTYFVDFYATIDGTPEQVGSSAWKTFPSDTLGANQYGVFMTIILFLVLVFVGSLHLYGAIFGSLALVFAQLIGILEIELQYTILIVIIAIILSAIVQMKKR